MKITTEQFLSALGIEVGKPFICDGVHTVITRSEHCDTLKFFNMEKKEETPRYTIIGVAWLIGKEITPLPKYTLTEDEKVIISLIDGDFITFGANKGYWIDGKFIPLKRGSLPTVETADGSVSLDELRKCL